MNKIKIAKQSDFFDVVVVGGGAGGVAAAVSASMAGARTLLVERYGFLGGAATAAQVLAYCGFYTSGPRPHAVTGGVGSLVLKELEKLGFPSCPKPSRHTGRWIVPLDGEAVKHALDNVVKAANVELCLHSQLIDTTVEGDHLKTITLADHTGARKIHATTFVDASGNADLSYFSGRKATVSPEEEGRPVQAASYPLRIGGVKSGLKIDTDLLKKAIVSEGLHTRIPLTRANGGFIGMLPGSGDVWWLAINLVCDGLSSKSLTNAEIQGRKAAWQNIRFLRQNIAGFENSYLVATGPELGVRESRRGLARSTVTSDDVLLGRSKEDKVACGGWPIEIHSAEEAVFHDIGGQGWFDIPYNATRSSALDNLWLAGRIIGCDEVAYGALRVMGTAFATGQAAGVAAASFVQTGGQIDVRAVQDELLKQGAILEPQPVETGS